MLEPKEAIIFQNFKFNLADTRAEITLADLKKWVVPTVAHTVMATFEHELSGQVVTFKPGRIGDLSACSMYLFAEGHSPTTLADSTAFFFGIEVGCTVECVFVCANNKQIFGDALVHVARRHCT